MRAQPLDLYFETNGVRLRYRDEGRGCAVIFVHGWTLDLDAWEAQATELARDFRVVRLDRRGFGMSSGLPSIAGDTADLVSLCEHLQLESAAFVGMSQGARVVVQFARSHPRMTSCLILDGPPQLGTPDAVGSASDLPYDHYCVLARTEGLSAFRREWSEHALARLRTSDPQTHALLARMILRYPGRDLTEIVNHGRAMPAVRIFEAVDSPVLIINGALDLESRKRWAKQLVSQLPRVEYAEIPAAGHLCNLDNPRDYNSSLRRFLETYNGRKVPS